jgi:serine/threonine protein kinase
MRKENFAFLPHIQIYVFRQAYNTFLKSNISYINKITMVDKIDFQFVKSLVELYNIPIISPKDLEIKQLIGQGGEAKVSQAFYKSIPVAVKEIHSFDKKCFEQEIAILSKLQHKNIPKFYGLVVEDKLALVMQLIKGGSLAQVELSELRKKYKLFILKQLAEVLDYMHSEGYVHRDLKPDNILLNDKAEVFLIDFGISKFISEEDVGQLETRAKGTLLYLAPETFDIVGLTNDADIICIVTNKVDVWAFGCITVFLFTAKEPWLCEYDVSFVQSNLLNKVDFPIPEDLDKSVYDIVKICTEVEPEKRASIAEIKKLLASLVQ